MNNKKQDPVVEKIKPNDIIISQTQSSELQLDAKELHPIQEQKKLHKPTYTSYIDLLSSDDD